MRRALQILLPVLVLGTGVSGAVWLILNKQKVTPSPQERFRPRVQLAEVVLEDYQPVVRSQGTARPRMEIGLSVEVSGRVVAMSPALVEGGLFEEGEELLRLDSNDYDLALRQALARMVTARAGITNALAQMSSARAQMAQAEARISREEAEAAAALAEWKLLGKAGRPPALLAREPQLKEARSALDSAGALLMAASAKKVADEADLVAAGAAADLAATNVLRCVVRAPFDGRVASRSVGLGQVASTGAVLARLQTVDVAEVRLALPLADFDFLGLRGAFRGGLTVTNGPTATLHGARGDEWHGRVTRSLGEVDVGTRMMSVVARVEDPYRRKTKAEGAALSFGRFVTAKIKGREMRGVVVLPRSALRGKAAVHVEQDGKLYTRKVQVAWTTREVVVIERGLKVGERVCLTPVDAFVEGMVVIVTEEAGDE